MACGNKENCPCKSTDCANFGSCCACINRHREIGTLVYCMRDIAANHCEE